MTVTRRFSGALIGMVLFAGIAPAASADTIVVIGTDSSQFSTATVVTAFNSQTNTLTFTATNTSAITEPGSTSTITGIGFDLPPTGNASASGLNGFTGMQAPSLSSSFSFSDADLGDVPLFDTAVLDFGFLTGISGTFAAGDVTAGLLPGESASFTVSGAAFTGFTRMQIENAIFLRFQNVPLTAGSDGSDVATTSASAPEPASLLLLATGVVAASARRWRQGSAKR